MKWNEQKQVIFVLIQLSCVSVFIGRAWQHLFRDAPFRALLWDEAIMSKPVQWILGMEWGEYLKHPSADSTIQSIIIAFGILYLIAAAAALYGKGQKRTNFFLLTGSLGLIFLAMLYCKEKFLTAGQFFEYSLQFSSPIFLYLFLKGIGLKELIFWMKVAIALTFVSHGLYALGIYPIPGNFVEMTMNILPIGQTNAILFLNIAGALDILVAILIFLPQPIAKWAVLYATIWGLLTALARVVGHFDFGLPFESILEWLYATVYRLPHAAIPVAVYLYLKEFEETAAN